MGIAALILGIVGVLVPGFGILLSIAALVLGIVAFRRRKQRGVALGGIITGGIGVVLGPVLAAIAIPAFVEYERRAKGSEAVIMLDRMYSGAADHYWSPRPGPGGTTVTGQLPPSIGWTPAIDCCQQSGGTGRCSAVANQSAWAAPTWQALGFELYDDFYYQYRFDVSGNRVLFQARGDLDCDGEPGLFTREAIITTDGLQVAPDGEREDNPTE
jgi:hypothetical protein